MRIKLEGNYRSSGIIRLAMCAPNYQALSQAMNGESVDATYIIQRYIASGLQAQGHFLSFIAPRNLDEIVCTNDPLDRNAAPQTSITIPLFDIGSKITWRIQQWLGIPYLNVYSNYRLYNVCLKCLPGHDLVYERNSLYKYGVAMACKRLRLPYVLYFEADDILEHDYMDKPITGLLRWRAGEAIRYNLKTANCIICVSDQSKTHLVTNWNVPVEKIVVFPNAADVQRFRPYPETRSEIRTSLRVNSNPLIIFVGNFYIWHDITTLLNAFAQVILTYPETRLILLGDGTQRQAMMNHANNIGIGHAVKFTGLMAHDEIPRLLGAADIAVAPYPKMQYEMWLSPIKLFEYLASGTAVIASAIGQLSNVIIDGYNGLLVPPGDTSAMAAAMKRLIEDSSLRSQLGQHAREDAVSKYSWEKYVSRLERLFNAVIAGKHFDLA
jgi:glycosyltransferase involved in cell wall biosynthesis